MNSEPSAVNVLYLTSDLLFGSRVTSAPSAGDAVARVRIVASADELFRLAATESPGMVILDLAHPDADPASCVAQIRALAPQARILAYAAHVLAAKLEEARAAGCDQVLTRGQFNSQLATILAFR